MPEMTPQEDSLGFFIFPLCLVETQPEWLNTNMPKGTNFVTRLSRYVLTECVIVTDDLPHVSFAETCLTSKRQVRFDRSNHTHEQSATLREIECMNWHTHRKRELAAHDKTTAVQENRMVNS